MNPWKLATFGIVGVLTTSLVTGLATAWMVRTPAQAKAVSAPPAPPAVRYAVVTPALPPRAAVARSAPSASVRPVAMGTAPADCGTTTGDRVWRIAKPGLIGTLLGAGAGAAGGAIADGGKAAGKGVLIGGLAGAALGSAYGAYQTKQECGSVFGGTGSGFTPAGDRVAVYDAGRSLPR